MLDPDMNHESAPIPDPRPQNWDLAQGRANIFGGVAAKMEQRENHAFRVA